MKSLNSERAPLRCSNSSLELKLVRQESSANAAQKHEQGEGDENAWITERGGVRCAGAHMIVDLYGASRLDELRLMEQTLRRCVVVAGATLLHIHLHRFEPNGGISGVAVLAESHISVHSWPERNYAALDIFMCGQARPERCIGVLLEVFNPKRAQIQEILRGRVND